MPLGHRGWRGPGEGRRLDSLHKVAGRTELLSLESEPIRRRNGEVCWDRREQRKLQLEARGSAGWRGGMDFPRQRGDALPTASFIFLVGPGLSCRTKAL